MATAFSMDRLLGGSELARAQEVEQGLPATALRAVLKDGAVTLSDLVDVVGKRRTLDRRLAADETLTLEESDRLVRFADILSLADHVIGSRVRAMTWLRAPQFEFDGTPPIALMKTHAGSNLVVNLLRMIQHGMLA